MKSPGTKSLASSPGPYRSTVAVAGTATSGMTPRAPPPPRPRVPAEEPPTGGMPPRAPPSPRARDLVEGPGPVGVDAASHGDSMREQLTEHRERQRGELLRTSRVG